MNVKRIAALPILLVVFGCSQPETQHAQAPSPAPEAPATFVNKVWKVTESTGMSPGQLVVFLSDSTLVFASANATRVRSPPET